MAITFFDGFEINHDITTNDYIINNVDWTITDNTAHSGNYCLELNLDSSIGYIEKQLPLDSTSWVLGFAIQFDNTPGNTEEYKFLRLYEEDDTFSISLVYEKSYLKLVYNDLYDNTIIVDNSDMSFIGNI